MSILGIDTSTAASAVCLLRSDGRAFEAIPDPAALAAPPAHARELMPAVAQVLAEGGVAFAELDAVAVGVGPGTFTGLRIGIATARGLAAARSLAIHPVSSLAALAAGAEDALALAVLDARRGEVFVALHAGDEERWMPFAARPEELAERLRAAAIAPVSVGDGAIRFRKQLEAVGASVPPDGSPRHVVRALHVCRLAARVPATAPEAVIPDYLRMPDAAPKPQIAAP